MSHNEPSHDKRSVRCGQTLQAYALPGIPTIVAGDDVATLITDALERGGLALEDEDVVIVTSKAFSRADDCFVDLARIAPGPRALKLAAEIDKDARLVELILSESDQVSRSKPGALIVRHRLGFISANAGIDASNAEPGDGRPGDGPWVLTLPKDPDQSAARLRTSLEERHGTRVAVVVTDSWGRPFRRGTTGFCVGVSGIEPIDDQRGGTDRFNRELKATMPAIADQIAALGDLVAGQAAESTPIVLVRGLSFDNAVTDSASLQRPSEEDLYA